VVQGHGEQRGRGEAGLVLMHHFKKDVICKKANRLMVLDKLVRHIHDESPISTGEGVE